jgi:hypothetical protein
MNLDSIDLKQDWSWSLGWPQHGTHTKWLKWLAVELTFSCNWLGRLLGMWKIGRRETPMKLHLERKTFTFIMVADTSVCFAGSDGLAQK